MGVGGWRLGAGGWSWGLGVGVWGLEVGDCGLGVGGWGLGIAVWFLTEAAVSALNFYLILFGPLASHDSQSFSFSSPIPALDINPTLQVYTRFRADNSLERVA